MTEMDCDIPSCDPLDSTEPPAIVLHCPSPPYGGLETFSNWPQVVLVSSFVFTPFFFSLLQPTSLELRVGILVLGFFALLATWMLLGIAEIGCWGVRKMPAFGREISFQLAQRFRWVLGPKVVSPS